MNQITVYLPQDGRWSYSELTRNGIAGVNVQQPNLTNAVHALFQFRHDIKHALELGEDVAGTMQIVEADNLRQHEWYFYRPAFQLATNFITCNAYLDWWMTLVFGPVSNVNGTNLTDFVLTYPPGDPEPLRRLTKDKLLELAAHLEFSFTNMEDERGAWGVAYAIQNGVEIELNEKFLLFARQALSQKAQLSGRPDPFPEITHRAEEGEISLEHEQRMQWMMAITLCRQCCHALWLWRHPNGAATRDTTIPEPRHFMDPRSTPTRDLGRTWEFWRLGYSTQEITPQEVDMYRSGQEPAPLEPLASGLAASFRGRDWPVPGAADVLCPLPSSYIASWFQEDTWVRIRAGQVVDGCRFIGSSRAVRVLDAKGNHLAP